jgi:hypothetical protein
LRATATHRLAQLHVVDHVRRDLEHGDNLPGERETRQSKSRRDAAGCDATYRLLAARATVSRSHGIGRDGRATKWRVCSSCLCAPHCREGTFANCLVRSTGCTQPSLRAQGSYRLVVRGLHLVCRFVPDITNNQENTQTNRQQSPRRRQSAPSVRSFARVRWASNGGGAARPRKPPSTHDTHATIMWRAKLQGNGY